MARREDWTSIGITEIVGIDDNMVRLPENKDMASPVVLRGLDNKTTLAQVTAGARNDVNAGVNANLRRALGGTSPDVTITGAYRAATTKDFLKQPGANAKLLGIVVAGLAGLAGAIASIVKAADSNVWLYALASIVFVAALVGLVLKTRADWKNVKTIT